jgi:hypothetical protein
MTAVSPVLRATSSADFNPGTHYRDDLVIEDCASEERIQRDDGLADSLPSRTVNWNRSLGRPGVFDV